MGFLLLRIIPPARFLDNPERLFSLKRFQRNGRIVGGGSSLRNRYRDRIVVESFSSYTVNPPVGHSGLTERLTGAELSQSKKQLNSMNKIILTLLVAISVASISSSTAATASTANYVGIFGTNSSQTNFVIPAGDSVYVAHWLSQTDGDGNPIGYATASINRVTKTVTNSIAYVGGKPKIVTVTNSITNSCNILLYDPQNYNSGLRILIPGPAIISTTSTAFQYKYFPKKSPYQVLLIQSGTTNPTSITIPAGQKLHQITMVNSDPNVGPIIGAVSMNGFGNILNGSSDFGYSISDVYGPATLSFIPVDPGDGTGSPGNFYFSYILINSDPTNIPITTP